MTWVKDYFRLFWKACLLIIGSAVAGLMLLVIVFAIPTERMEKNVTSSAEYFDGIGMFPYLNFFGGRGQSDNFTDATMLLNASYTHPSNVVDRAVGVYRPVIEDENPNDVVVSYFSARGRNSQYDIISYGRYWHGYLTVLKPVLMFLTYGQIRILNAILVISLGLFLICVMWKKGLRRYILPYLLALWMIDPVVISQSMQFTTVYYIYTIASIIFLLKREWLEESEERLVLFFVLIGCTTSYFDFLTYPLVTFGVPVTLYLCSAKSSLKKTAEMLVVVLIAWFLGYVGMWAGKWILGTLLGSENIIADALETVKYRSSMEDSTGMAFTLFGVIKSNLRHMVSSALIPASIYILITCIQILRHFPKEKVKDFTWTLYIGVCLLPIIWILGASNHSWIHHWFTYREAMIAAFAGLCMFSRYATKTIEIAEVK